jgi:hypothetical protein
VRGERPSVSLAVPQACQCGPLPIYVIVNRAIGPTHVTVRLDGRTLATTRRRRLRLTVNGAELSHRVHKLTAVLVADHQRIRFTRVLHLCACPRAKPPPRFTG